MQCKKNRKLLSKYKTQSKQLIIIFEMHLYTMTSNFTAGHIYLLLAFISSFVTLVTS